MLFAFNTLLQNLSKLRSDKECSQTCIKRTPLGKEKSDLLRKVTS